MIMLSLQKVGLNVGYISLNSAQICAVGVPVIFDVSSDSPGDFDYDYDPSVVTISPKSQKDVKNLGANTKRLTITGKKNGSSILTIRKKENAGDNVQLGLTVVSYDNQSMVGQKIGDMTTEMRAALNAIPLRDAVIAVAYDQMFGKQSQQNNGFGYYHLDGKSSENWCGYFCVWCWLQACAAKGIKPPVFTSGYNLSSPQQAITWAMKDSTPGQLLRYSGGPLVGLNPYTGPPSGLAKYNEKLRAHMAQRQEYREIGYNGYQLERGDIVLVRQGKDGKNWPHVCMIDSVNGDRIYTIEGNVKGGGSFTGQTINQSIARLERSRDERTLNGKDYKLVYIHMLV
jgi:hypothetical protein